MQVGSSTARIVIYTLTKLVHHLPLADYIVVLDGSGNVSGQGKLDELLHSDADASKVLRHSAFANDPTTLSLETLGSGGPAPAIKSTQDMQDLTRQTSDLGIYYYYFKSVGWTRALLFLIFATLYIFLGKFPRK